MIRSIDRRRLRGGDRQADGEHRQAIRLALHLDAAAHRLRQLLDDRQPEAGSDRPLPTVAGVEVEALERVLAILLPETRPGVLHPQPSRFGHDPYLASGGRETQGVLDQVGDHLQHAIGVGDRRGRPGGGRAEPDLERRRLLLVAADGVVGDLGQVDLRIVDAEVGAVHARQVEQVAHQPPEALGLDGEHVGRLLRAHHPLAQRLGIPADRGQRRLQLVADREEEASLRRASRCELLGELVEGEGERGQLGGTFDRQRLRMRAAREAPARRGDPRDGPDDPPREQVGGDRGENAAGDRGDDDALDEGCPPRIRQAPRPEEDERALPDRLRGEVVGGAPDRDGARGRLAGGQLVAGPLRQHGRVEQVALVLVREVRPELRQVRERRERALLLADDQRRLVRDVLERRVLDRAARQDQPEPERDRDRERGDRPDRAEQPRAKAGPRLHACTSLYPAPRTVRIPAGSPSLRRSCATCTSTVRVPPG